MPRHKDMRRLLQLTGIAVLLISLLATPPVVQADDENPPRLLNNAVTSVLSVRKTFEDSLEAYREVQNELEAHREVQNELGARHWDMLRSEIVTYEVQPGDNDWTIARRFDLDIDTLRFSNEWMRRNPDLIYPGQEVVVLPLPGAYYAVEAGDTVYSIAERYGVAPSDITEFPLNNLNGSDLIQVGQKLVIPGGRLDYAQRILPPGSGTGYALAWPLRGTVSQGYHSAHHALDVASYYGARVYASRGGRVSYARFSPGGWLGFTVTIVHDNGMMTRYCHLSGIFIEEGQVVSRGEVIGQVGSTGNSTGPHVHFEVFDGGVKINPYNVLPPSQGQ